MTGSGGKPRFRSQADAILAPNQNIENNPMQSSGRSPAMGVIRPNSFSGSADLYSEGAMGLVADVRGDYRNLAGIDRVADLERNPVGVKPRGRTDD